VTLLRPAGVLTVGHAEGLALLATAAADNRRTRAEFKASGYSMLLWDERYHATTGILLSRRPRENPLLRKSTELTLLVNRLLGEFGLTPITSPKVEAMGAPEERSEFESFIGGHRG
jgi:hypothetical protein